MTVAKKAEDIVDEAAFQMEIAALATLDELAYRRIRKAKARAFELTLSDLDKLVEKERRKAKQKENKNKNPLVQRGFISDETGLSWRDPFNDGPPHHLAGPLNTRATTRDAHNNRWGLLGCGVFEHLTAADGVGQGSVIPCTDPSRISRLRPRLALVCRISETPYARPVRFSVRLPLSWQAPRRGWPRKVRAAEGVTP
jgi:hypothetical protein